MTVRRRSILGTTLLVAAACAQPANAQIFSTKEESLQRTFPGRSVERKTIFLTDAQVEEVRRTARTAVESRVVTYYIARDEHGVAGYVFFDTHTVRTMPETFMVAIRPDSTVAGIEILAFHEPVDYLPDERWLQFFVDRRLTDDLWIKRSIPNITGATLSTRSINEGVRRFLALFESIVPKE